MARQPKPGNPEEIREKLVTLLADFKKKLSEGDLRKQVLELVPVNHLLRDLGSSLIVGEDTNSARNRILAYLQKYSGELVHGDELMVVAGISEYARRVRELRVQMGWPVLSGATLKTMSADDPSLLSSIGVTKASELKPDHYMLIKNEQDKEAAWRWNLANSIRKSNLSVRDKLLKFFRENVGNPVTGEELQYLAKNNKEWARRVRELRTEEGRPIVTRNTGNLELPVGVYMLEEDRQAPEHDRKIPDPTRAEVLERDKHTCQLCGWTHEQRNPSNPKAFLELHHIEHHAKGGKNSVENLITLCNVCHDQVHRKNTPPEELKKLIG